MASPNELAGAYARENLGLNTGTSRFGRQIGQTVMNGIGADGVVIALTAAFSVKGPDGKGLVSPNTLNSALTAAGITPETLKSDPGKINEVLRTIRSVTETARQDVITARARQQKITDIDRLTPKPAVPAQTPKQAAGAETVQGLEGTEKQRATATIIARSQGIPFQEALNRVLLSEVYEDRGDAETAALILARGASALTADAAGGGAAAAPSYQFQQINVGGKSTLWKTGTDGTLVDTGIAIDVPLTSIKTNDAGDLVGFNPTTNQMVLIQKGFTFPTQDPSVVTTIDQATGASIAVNTRTGETRNLGTYNFPQISPERTFQEQQDVSRLGNALAARGQDMSYETAVRNADIAEQQMQRTAGLNEFEKVRNILSNPSDYLARAFLSQGRTAPGGQITQADLINQLREEIGPYKQVSQAAPVNQFNPSNYMAQLQAATRSAAPPAVPPIAPVVPPVVPQTNAGGLGYKVLPGGGIALDADLIRSGGVYTPSPPNIPLSPTSPMMPPPDQNGGLDVGQSVEPRNPQLSDGQPLEIGFNEMNAGGYTNEPAFIVGDSRSGRPNGYEEMIVNPTGAPLKVVPNSRLPRFQEGTGFTSSSVTADQPEELGLMDMLMNPLWKPTRTGSRGFDTTMDVLSSFTSPLDLALMMASGGLGAKAAIKGLKAIRGAKGAAQAAKEAAASAAEKASNLPFYPPKPMSAAEAGVRSMRPLDLYKPQRLAEAKARFSSTYRPGHADYFRRRASLDNEFDRAVLKPRRPNDMVEPPNLRLYKPQRIAEAEANPYTLQRLAEAEARFFSTYRPDYADYFRRRASLDNKFDRITEIYKPTPIQPFNLAVDALVRPMALRRRVEPSQLPLLSGGTGYLPRYAKGSGAPIDLFRNTPYDWYDAGTGEAGYNPGRQLAPSRLTSVPSQSWTQPTWTTPTPVTQQGLTDMARQWTPPRIGAVLGEGAVGPMQSPVQSASYRQTQNLTPDDMQAFGTRLAAEGTSLTDYGALQKGLFGTKRTSRLGRLIV